MLNICYGDTFIVDHGQTSYIVGYKFDMEVDINMFLPSVLQKHLQGMMGNISVEKVNFGISKKSLAHGLILLYEGTYDIFLEILKKLKMIEIYLEHNLDKVNILIEDESTVIKNKIIRDIDVYDLVVKDTREKVEVTDLVGLAERYDAVNKELCSYQTQDSLHEEKKMLL